MILVCCSGLVCCLGTLLLFGLVLFRCGICCVLDLLICGALSWVGGLMVLGLLFVMVLRDVLDVVRFDVGCGCLADLRLLFVALMFGFDYFVVFLFV